jgi:cobalt-zinc-cadmium efflux system outer membrane protein
MRSARAAFAAALFFPAMAWGQDASRAVPITEAEFLAVPGGESAALRALREDVGLARADALAARTLRNPRFAANHEAPADATKQLDLIVAWELPRPDRRRLAIDAAEAGIAAAESRFALEELGVRLSMREAFAQWALAAERTAMLAGFAERLDVLARNQRQRADAGEVSGLESRRMALAAAQARGDLARAQSEAAQARAAALVWRPDLGRDLRPVLPEVPPAPELEASHPNVAAIEADLTAARLRRDLAARVIDLPEVVGGWQRQRTDDGFTAEGPLVGLEWPLPLFDRGRAERARAEVRIDALEARLAVARLTLEAGREGALAAYERLRAASSEAATAGESVEPMLAAATASFRAGEVDLTDLLETLRAGSSTRLQALELRAAALEAHRELERLTGGR